MALYRNQLRSHCPINFGLEIFGDCWTLLIVRDALFFGKRRFREFLESEERIATNILTDRLQRLVRSGILSRRRASEGREGPVYGLTEKGLGLLPVLLEISMWSSQHDPKTLAPRSFMHQIKADRAGVIKAIRKRVRAGLPGFDMPAAPQVKSE